MRSPFQLSKTTVSMRRAELTAADLGIAGPKTDKVVAVEWQIIYTKDGRDSIHLVRATEAEADADMDAIKVEAGAFARNAAIGALYNCGQGRIDYTRGVLDALGYDDLSFEIATAAAEVEASKPEPAETSSFADALGAPPASDAYHAAIARLRRAFGQVEQINEQLRDEA